MADTTSTGGLSNLFSAAQNIAKAIGQLNQTLGNLILSAANTWASLQTFAAGITLSGGAANLSPPNASVTISPTGTGVVTVNPATTGTMNNVIIGGTTPAAGTFTSVTSPVVTTPSVATSTNLVLGNGSAIALSATTGWVEIPTCAGTPTGVPSNAGAGKAAIVLDISGAQLWVYDYATATWKGVGVS